MLWSLYLLSMYVVTIEAATHEDLTRLHKKLMENYNKDLRPTFNLSQPTKVYLGFQLLSLKEFEEKTGKFAVVGMFAIFWHDFQMEWNPTDFGGIDHTFLPQSSVWTPDMILMNPFDKIEPPGFNRQKVGVYSTGVVNWGPADVYEVTCQADVTFYPFDQQKCSLVFGLYMVTVIDVTIETFSDDIQTDFYYPNGIWELKDTTCKVYPVLNSPTLTLTIAIKRRPMFQIINTIVPFSILGLLNVMVFLLPAESGERVGFTITVFLAIAVFMSIVTETLPGTSEPSFPRLCYLLAAELCINALVTVCTILVLKLHHKSKHEAVPSWLQHLTCKCVCFHSRNKIDDNLKNNTDLNNQRTICIETVVSKIQESERNKTVSEKIWDWNCNDTENGNSNPQPEGKYSCGKTSWQSIAHFLDVFLFVFFIVVFLTNKIVAYVILS